MPVAAANAGLKRWAPQSLALPALSPDAAPRPRRPSSPLVIDLPAPSSYDDPFAKKALRDRTLRGKVRALVEQRETDLLNEALQGWLLVLHLKHTNRTKLAVVSGVLGRLQVPSLLPARA